MIDFRDLRLARAERKLSPEYDEDRRRGEMVIADPNETRNREALEEADKKLLARLEEEERLKKKLRKYLREKGGKKSYQALTARQFQVLRAIEWFIRENGIPPVSREVGLMLGGLTSAAAMAHINALEKKGYLTRERRTSRSIRVLIPSSEIGRELIPRKGGS